MDDIREFRGAFRFLSNYYQAPIVVNGVRYPTNEHAFAAFKTHDEAARRRIAGLATPGEAKRAGRAVVLRSDWEQIKGDIMLALVRAKFKQHPDLAAKLLATGEVNLVEGNTWNDRVWGVDLKTGVGENRLGKTLMQVRSELRTLQEPGKSR